MSVVEIKHGNRTFKYHELLFKNISELKKANLNDWDFKLLFSGDGMTRTGKSTIASQTSIVIDPSTTLDHIVFRGDKLISTSLKLGRNKVVIYDEAKEGLDSKKAMNRYSQTITDYFSECGFLNQFLLIVLPEFFDLNKTVALNQSICLINCYTRNNFQRGYFNFYNRKDKRYLYIKGKKYNNYKCQKASWDGTFTDYFPFDIEEYNKRKLENMRAGKEEKEKLGVHEKIWKTRFQLFANNLIEQNILNQRQIAKLCETDEKDISKYMIEFRESHKK